MSSTERLASSPYNAGMEKTGSSKRKWIILGSIAALVIIGAAVGVAVGVTQHNKNKTNNDSSKSSSGDTGSSSGSSSGSSGSSGNGTTQTDPNDPSQFTKDPRLHKSFYGLAYTPTGSIYPNCSIELSDVIEDIQIMSQLTDRVRLYGSDCNQSAIVLEAIRQTKVELKVFLGNYPEPGQPDVYTRQNDAIEAAIKTYGTDHILGITVGNEFILDYLADNDPGSDNPNSAIANVGGEMLVGWINDTRSMLAGLGLSDMPVGNSDAGYYFNDLVLEAVDYGLANVHPWFAGTTIQDAASWTFSNFISENVDHANTLPNKPDMYIAETGWPTASNDTADDSDGASIASQPNLQIFIDDFVCQANANNTKYFFFEFFDEAWKEALYGGVEGYWGLFYGNKTLKDITIPDCASP